MLAFLNIGWPEVVIILVVALLLFGGKRLPELAQSLGKGIREFKKELGKVKDDLASDDKPAEKDDDKSADTEDPYKNNQDKA